MAETLPVIVRPNGKVYRPRKLVAHAFEDDHAGESGVVVLGTHDPERARELALSSARYWYGTEYIVDPVTVWWHDAMECGERRWRHDAARGRAGVCFTASDDPPAS
jgi:hypothetical protein